MARVRTGIALALTLALAACAAPADTVAVTSATPAPTVRYTPIPTATATPVPLPSATPTPEPDYTKEPDVAQELPGLIVQVIATERAVRDPNVTGQKLAYYGWLQHLTYGQLSEFPDWAEPLIASMPDDVRPAVKDNVNAGRELRRLRGPTPKTFPDWRIVEPKPIETLMTYYKEAEAKLGVPWTYLAAINLVETRMGRIRGVSSAGAQGPMQFMPATWAAYGLGGNVNDERDAIMGAANYLKASGAPGDMDRALFAYNRHIGYVNAIKFYAQVLQREPLAYRGYHGWQVYYPTVDGVFHLAPGWTKPQTP